jgi:hypothetical protein
MMNMESENKKLQVVPNVKNKVLDENKYILYILSIE